MLHLTEMVVTHPQHLACGGLTHQRKGEENAALVPARGLHMMVQRREGVHKVPVLQVPLSFR